MSQYKKVMQTKGIQQKEVLDAVHRVDARVDKPLLSKIVNDVCLPTPQQFKVICDTLVCAPSDIYDPREVEFMPTSTADTPATNVHTAKTRKRRQNIDIYNLTVEIPRDVAERVFAPAALRKLGYLSKSDFVRQAVGALDTRLAEINKKAADGADTPTTANGTVNT